MKLKNLVLFALCCAAFVSCKGGKGLLPNISGKAGEVLVVSEKACWDGPAGGILRDSLRQDCPFLPQREALYSVTFVPGSSFTQMFQIHRNIIILNVSAGVNAPGIVYRKDKWAQPQLVVSVNASSTEEAVDLLSANMHTILGAIEQAERERVITNTRNYQERKLAGTVKDFIGGDMVFPSGYGLKKKTDDFMWISYETTYVQQGFFIYTYPALGVASELSAEALTAKRNEVLKAEVPGMVAGSYMTTATILPPTVKYAAYKGLKYAELRGLWDVEGDYMGGPFVSHTFYTPDGRRLVCIEAYVYAPKYDKRHYLRQVESLLFAFKWEDSQENLDK